LCTGKIDAIPNVETKHREIKMEIQMVAYVIPAVVFLIAAIWIGIRVLGNKTVSYTYKTVSVDGVEIEEVVTHTL